MTKDLLKVSKFLSRVLRHEPELLGLTTDCEGWVDIELLIAASEKYGFPLSVNLLTKVVQKNDKQRFAFNVEKTKIRANQGHTINVDIDYREACPTWYLYHGTNTEAWESIKVAGISKMERNFVHLVEDISVAEKVGYRKGIAKVLAVDAKQMCRDGAKFFLSENNVWLTDQVPVKSIVSSRLDSLIKNEDGPDFDSALYGRFPLQISSRCGSAEVKDVLFELDKASEQLRKVFKGDCESRDDLRIWMGGLSNLLKKLVGEHGKLISEGLNSVYPETRYRVLEVFCDSPDPLVAQQIASLIGYETSEDNLRVARKALDACETAQASEKDLSSQELPSESKMATLGVLDSVWLRLPLKREPIIDLCRDGGSISATFSDLWGSEYILELPVRLGTTKEQLFSVKSYKTPILEKVIKSKRRSKVSGRTSFNSQCVEIKASHTLLLGLCTKIVKATTDPNKLELALDLLHGVEYGAPRQKI